MTKRRFTFGTVMVVTPFFVIVIGAVAGGIMSTLHGCEASPPCMDAVTMVSSMPAAQHAAVCYNGGTMELEDRVQGVLVKCICPKDKK